MCFSANICGKFASPRGITHEPKGIGVFFRENVPLSASLGGLRFLSSAYRMSLPTPPFSLDVLTVHIRPNRFNVCFSGSSHKIP